MNRADLFHLLPRETYEQFAPILAKHAGDSLAMILRCLVPYRWVTAKAYGKHYNMSEKSVYNYRDNFARRKAVSGMGKGTRYDKFYDARNDEWRVPDWIN